MGKKRERVEVERERDWLFISFLERGKLILLLHLLCIMSCVWMESSFLFFFPFSLHERGGDQEAIVPV